MAGLLTPLIRPMRNSAEAIVAPVLPADTIADAVPSRTASAARTSVASFFRRTPPAGSSPISITSDAAMRGSPFVSRSSGPTSATSIPSSSAARRAPATISPGALSPPMASTATGSISDDLGGAASDGVGAVRRRRRRGSCTSRRSGRPRGAAWPSRKRAERAPARRAAMRRPGGCAPWPSTASSWDCHRRETSRGDRSEPAWRRLGRLSEAGRSYRAIGRISDQPPGARLQDSPSSRPGAARDRPTADPRGPARSRTGRRCGRPARGQMPAQSGRQSGAGGSSMSTSSWTIGPRSSCSPSKVKASSLVGCTW